jgi:hypothetical protein
MKPEAGQIIQSKESKNRSCINGTGGWKRGHLVSMLILAAACLWSIEASSKPATIPANSLVEDWNELFVEAVQAESTPPGLAARNLAIFHLAIYRAVNEASKSTERVDPSRAATSAAHLVAVSLYPSRSAVFDKLYMDSIGGAPRPDSSSEWGRSIAEVVLADRKNDGASRTVHYVPLESSGMWRRTTNNRPPELPQWPGVKPFALESAAMFRPSGPPELNSTRYANSVEEVRRVGGKSSPERTKAQALTARFWADFTYTSTPPGHWNEIARDVASRNNLSLHDSARLFALLNVALADAGIAAFDCKYHFNHWRPITAINQSAPELVRELEWEPFLPTPTHPEYVSAHSTFSGAAAEILKGFFGSDQTEFIVTSFDVPGVIRTYQSFDSCAEEIGLSRIFGGIHFNYSNQDGLILGRKVAKEVEAEFDRRLAPR